jgi:hypothetical protein
VAVVACLVVVGLLAGGAVLATRGSSSSGDDRGEADRLDIAVVGDSLVEQSRDQLQAHAEDQGMTVESFALGGSAPCDWVDIGVFQDLAADRPRHLIISFAGNDYTPCINPGGGPPRDPQTIADAYADDMPGIVEPFVGTDTEVHVVVPPPVGEPASEPAAAAIRAMYRELAEAHPGVTVIDPAPLLGSDGRFALTLPCREWESDGCAPDGTIALRDEDGIHLTPAGGERYARVLLDGIGRPVDG